jgi:hypothetical protein
MDISKIKKTLYGYLIIPVWILFFFGTTGVLIALSLNAWIRTKWSGKKATAQFKQRTIFPYEHL